MGVEGRRGRECVTSTLPEHNRTCHFPFFHASLYSMYFSFPSFASFSYLSIFSSFFFLPVVTFSLSHIFCCILLSSYSPSPCYLFIPLPPHSLSCSFILSSYPTLFCYSSPSPSSFIKSSYLPFLRTLSSFPFVSPVFFILLFHSSFLPVTFFLRSLRLSSYSPFFSFSLLLFRAFCLL